MWLWGYKFYEEVWVFVNINEVLNSADLVVVATNENNVLKIVMFNGYKIIVFNFMWFIIQDRK